MRGLVWNCKDVGWISEGTEDKVSECLLVFCCFETEDSIREVNEAARRVRQVNRKRFGRGSVGIFPFAHLSSSILPTEQAGRFINKLAEKLTSEFKTVKILPFNKDKEVTIRLLGKNEDVTYFEY